MVNNAVIDYPDRKVTNGVIHVIDQVSEVTHVPIKLEPCHFDVIRVSLEQVSVSNHY